MCPIFDIFPSEIKDRDWVHQFMIDHWGGEEIIIHDELFYPSDLPGFICQSAGEIVGLITYCFHGKSCEIITLDSVAPNQGIGSALLERVELAALQNQCHEIHLVTTNDNLNALGFYQKRGFFIKEIRSGAVNESRKRKPGIPLLGMNDIPIRDEIFLFKELPRIK